MVRNDKMITKIGEARVATCGFVARENAVIRNPEMDDYTVDWACLKTVLASPPAEPEDFPWINQPRK